MAAHSDVVCRSVSENCHSCDADAGYSTVLWELAVCIVWRVGRCIWLASNLNLFECVIAVLGVCVSAEKRRTSW